MKKTFIILALSAILLSCESNQCSCYQPIEATTEVKRWVDVLGVYHSRTDYYGIYKDDCGKSKKVSLTKAEYDVFNLAAKEICE